MAETATDSPVLATTASVTAESVERCHLDSDALILARLAALVATRASTISYLPHVWDAIDAGVTIERVRDLLVAIAPIVGSERVMSAASSIRDARAFLIEIADEANG